MARKTLGLHKCKNCGKDYEKYHSKHYFCCRECKDTFLNNKNSKKYEYTCDNCNNKFYSHTKRKGNHTFCCHKCSVEFTSKSAKVVCVCEQCGKDFECNKSEKLRFCSMKCQSVWQSEYLVGENSNRYIRNIDKSKRKVVCKTCGKVFYVRPSSIGKARFCSKSCSLVGISKSDTKPNILIRDLLLDMGVNFDTEVKSGRYYIDILCDVHRFPIEVMGDYWHCNPSTRQLVSKKDFDTRFKDVRKHDYVLSNLGVEILYLWEYDINNNLDLCKKLISKYIRKNGKLENYHSFNYHLNKYGTLKLNDEIILFDVPPQDNT